MEGTHPLNRINQENDGFVCITAAAGTDLSDAFSSGTCFFLQAEDGIRGAQRSRGLGYVYKRPAYLGI